MQESKTYFIRKGTKKDMAAVWQLINELAIFEKEPHAVETCPADLERDGFSSNPLFETYVATLEGEIVGVALFYFRYSTWKGRTLHLEDLIVTKAHQRKGIGLALFKKVMEKARKEKVRRAEWNVLDWNQTAISFYAKSGAIVLPDWRVVQKTF